jgi:uncharacterized membrane protein YebE (DUF533 family)
MFDAKRLLDQFLGAGALGTGGAGFDLSKAGDAARNVASSTLGGGNLGGIAGGALAGGLAGILLGSKGGRKLAGSAAKIGGVALVGALAYQAYRKWQEGQAGQGQPGQGQPVQTQTVQTQPASPTFGATQPAPAQATGVPLIGAPFDTPFNPASAADQQAMARGLLRAMIAAAKADGQIDAEEQARVFAEMDKLQLDPAGKAFVMDELRAPLDIDAVAAAARTPEEAAEIYAASLLAVRVDTAAERGYLSLLAARLGLDQKLIGHLHATVAGAAAGEPAAIAR